MKKNKKIYKTPECEAITVDLWENVLQTSTDLLGAFTLSDFTVDDMTDYFI